MVENLNAELSFIVTTKTSDNISFVGPLKYLKTSGLSLINIDEANFKLKRLKYDEIYIGSQDFQDQITNYYIEKIINEIKKMAFSIGFFGSPRTLVKYCRDGISDFVEMPLEGWQDGRFLGGVKGFGNGSLSLTKNFSVGVI